MPYITASVTAALQVEGLGLICLIFAGALMLRAAIGFGDGLLAVPLLALFMDLREAVPLILLVSTTMSIVALWKSRHHIQLGSLKRTSLAALVGIPLGVLLLSWGDEQVVKGLLGIIIIAMAAWKLGPASSFRLKGNVWSYIFGVLAGCLGSAYALRGIVFSIYGSLRGWGPEQFKSTIHGFYLLSGVLIPFSYYGAGLITQKVLGLYLIMLPIALVSTLLGHRMTSGADTALFQKVIWIFLLTFGVVLLANLIRS